MWQLLSVRLRLSGQPVHRISPASRSEPHVKVLPNGLTLIVCERPEAPVFSFYTLVDAGSPTIPRAHSGLAHMFEHMAFKGSTEIGTTNYPAEKIALAKVEDRLCRLRRRVPQARRPGPGQTRATQKSLSRTRRPKRRNTLSPTSSPRSPKQNGAVGINASTGEDSTQYFWSMPSNRLELWAYLESQRIGHPVQREFYKERDVVQEERRMRIDSVAHRPHGRAVPRHRLRRASLRPPRRRLGERDQPGHRHRGRRLPQEVLRPLEHRHRRRRRRQSLRGDADPRALLLADSAPAPSPSR